MLSSSHSVHVVGNAQRLHHVATAQSPFPLFLRFLAGLTVCSLVTAQARADWPMWRGNSARTAVTEERLPDSLSLQWSLCLAPPRPAWPEEQGKVRFDASYEPVVADGRIFIPSMVCDSVTAYAVTDGRPLWCFYADAPVRFAPVVHGDRLLFVSDDGYLYCVSTDKGELIWKVRGGPADQWILGNDRLISMWPARGAPVTYDGTVYFAAGIWPFMGVFVHAVDIHTGTKIWTNSGTGSNYVVQQHDSPAFAGIAPQGYLAVNQQILLVSGGMTVPAAFDRATGQLLYFRPGDRTIGRDQGGYEVVIGSDWFANRGGLLMLADGQPRLKTSSSVFAPDCAIGISGKHLLAHGNEIIREVETSVDKKGKETKSVKYRVEPLWRARLPEGISQLHIQAANQLLASDESSRVVLLDIPTATDTECHVAWEGYVVGSPWRMLVSDQRLFVVTQQGGVFCFGAASNRPGIKQVTDVEESAAQVPFVRLPLNASNEPKLAASRVLAHTTDRAGYALLDQPTDIELVRELTLQTDFHILVTQPDDDVRTQWRQELQAADLLGTRVAVLPDSLSQLHLPPYLANLVVCFQMEPSPEESGNELQRVFAILRPYGGKGVLYDNAADGDLLRQAHSASQLAGSLQVVGNDVTLTRPGPLPDSGTWTSQSADAGNTLVSQEGNVKVPLGLLWFGGPSNRDVLPRHGHGPTPQVVGGRLFIEGRDMLRAVDVYTGRLLWQREFKDVGIFYDHTDHHPGANAIGGNFVTTPDSVYLIWQQRCLRLHPATGETLAEFELPGDASGKRPVWGYLAVAGDQLVAGSSPVLLNAPGPGEKAPEDNAVRHLPFYSSFGEGSRRLVVMDRFRGQVRWTRDARFNFRHNAIAVGDGKVFCLDRMTETRLAFYRRRGYLPALDFRLYALDLLSGEPIWQSSENVFGTWLAFEPRSNLLLQAGSKNRDRAADEVGEGMAVYEAATGDLLWHSDVSYGGPPLLYQDTIITQGTAIDLRTGQRKDRTHPLTGELLPWEFARNYGCNTAIGCLNLLTFRSAAAGYFDLAHDGGTGNLGGFRSSCTPNLIAADGVLSAPDYTRTCTCSYQNQCSLAMVHMPEAEMWTFNAIASSGKRVQRLGINFGAPGDRRAADGTLWLDFPSVGGPSPDVPLLISGTALQAGDSPDTPQTSTSTQGGELVYFREHSSLVETREPKWVFASGVRGASHLRIRLASREEAAESEAQYVVRLYLRTSPGGHVESDEWTLRLQGIEYETGSARQRSEQFSQGAMREYSSVAVSEFLDIEIVRRDGETAPQWLDLCGLEVFLAR